MQRPKKHPSNSQRRSSSRPTGGRVVDLRRWKTRKKFQSMRNTSGWARILLLWLTIALAVLAGLFAAAGCIPFRYQPQSIILAWLFATLGAAGALWLNALRHRQAVRLLSVFVFYLALSLVAAVVKVYTTAP